ncbi:MAG: ribosome maturation factor RimM [Coprococcus sp.]
MEKYLRVGVISSTHGVRGEAKIYPTTDDVARFKKLKTCLLDTGKEYKELHIESVKFFKQMVILKFREFGSIDDLMPYKGRDLLVTRDQAVELEEDEYFICDLIGLRVVTDEGEDFGELTEVMQTGANDVYVVKRPDGREVLLPVIRDCILDVDLEKQQVTAHIMPGLLD